MKAEFNGLALEISSSIHTTPCTASLEAVAPGRVVRWGDRVRLRFVDISKCEGASQVVEVPGGKGTMEVPTIDAAGDHQ
jgi:hypothetical protein